MDDTEVADELAEQFDELEYDARTREEHRLLLSEASRESRRFVKMQFERIKPTVEVTATSRGGPPTNWNGFMTHFSEEIKNLIETSIAHRENKRVIEEKKSLGKSIGYFMGLFRYCYCIPNPALNNNTTERRKVEWCCKTFASKLKELGHEEHITRLKKWIDYWRTRAEGIDRVQSDFLKKIEEMF